MLIKYFLTFFVIFTVLSSVKCDSFGEDIDLNSLKNIYSKIKLDEIELFLSKEVETLKIVDKYDNYVCALQLLMIAQGLQKGELWALKLFDSWAKPNAGYLSLNLISFGAYDQCLKFSYNHSSAILIEGQYCNVMFSIPITQSFSHLNIPRDGALDALNIPLNTAVCIPKMCDPQYFKTILDAIGSQIGLPVQDYDQAINCNDGRDPGISSADIVAITFFSVISALILVSTIYDIITFQNRQRINIFLAFSFYTNLIKLFKTAPQSVLNKDSDLIGCLHGIRCLSMIWIIFSHRVSTFTSSPTINMTFFLQWIKQYPSMFIVSGTVAVDTFFLLSGFLITRSILKELDRKRSLNVPYMYLHRYLRLTPSLAILMFYHVTLFKYSGSGPYWKVGVDAIEKTCKANWWINLLYFQNYYRKMETCFGHTWYLAIDMQLYIISPLLVWPLWKYGRKFLPVLIALLWFWLITLFTYFVDGKYHMSIFAIDERTMRTFLGTHTRYGLWLVGLLLAYFMYFQNGKRIKLHWSAVMAGWIFSLGMFAAVIFGIQPLAQLNFTQHSQWNDTMYGTFSILAWSLGLSWMIWASVNGYGGFINSFLSWSFWQPLGRLTYSMYLIHFPLQITKLIANRVPTYFSNVNAAYMFWGDFGFTLSIAIIWTLAFESPIIILEKFIFGRADNDKKGADNHGVLKDVMA